MPSVCCLCPILARIEVFVEVPNVNFVNASSCAQGIVPPRADGPDKTNNHFEHSLTKAHTVSVCYTCYVMCIWQYAYHMENVTWSVCCYQGALLGVVRVNGWSFGVAGFG